MGIPSPSILQQTADRAIFCPHIGSAGCKLQNSVTALTAAQANRPKRASKAAFCNDSR
ncbi:hypothetical protein P171DRAFT_437700 [Karstenula rhodostoma CBS 690.94]|uniref:Uncharacterized protein n=1 Tax=Karstenula rhodostoma CBS 690.94 TaxID=1392251 RepID=A0A9P4P3J4_9PLEO|nr:hypothetical protein P171DRAFT_437700 [Karstenula rhodostoma CBS 690.94]